MIGTITVLITGAAGQIAHNLSNAVANGNLFGEDREFNLYLLDIEPTMPVLEGVVMELQDCASSVLEKIVPTSPLDVAFKDIDNALMVGAMPLKQEWNVGSFPVTIDKRRHYKIIDGLSMDDWSKELFKITADELEDERAVALEICNLVILVRDAVTRSDKSL
ncbi:hypothetical protein ACTXT7_000346 [Hymenolepis weldensis]